jgi:hypothetical protein
MIHYATAETAEEIARLLRSRGRIVVTAPPRSGKTTELLKYAEERYPNGRFAVVCARKEDHKYILKLHWRLYNGISFVDVVAKRLLGEELEGEDVNTPMILTPETVCYRVFNPSTPVFVDEWNSLDGSTQSSIIKRRLFIAATTS